jgi:hypothetical protein
MGQPINHRGGGRGFGPESLSQLGEADRGQRTDEVQRGELQERHPAAGPDGGAGHDHGPQVSDEPIDVLRRDHRRLVASYGSNLATGRTDADQQHAARINAPTYTLMTDRHVLSLGRR